MTHRGFGDWRSNRVDPDALSAFHIDHLTRYQFAAPFAKNGRVLDVGCATGYGTSLLAYSAQSALGIDPNEDAIEYAHARFFSDTCSFRKTEVSDIGESNAFDLVVAFEVIEHVDDPYAFVRSIHRLLRDDGTMILSTPHRPVSAPHGGVSDPTHIREFDRNELEQVIRHGGFEAVEFYGQHIGNGMWRRHGVRARLGRLDILGLRRLIPTRWKARAVVAVADLGASEDERTTTSAVINDSLDGAFVQLAVCRK